MHLGYCGLTIALLVTTTAVTGAPADSTEIIRSLSQNYYVINCNYVDGILRGCFTPPQTNAQPRFAAVQTLPPPPPTPQLPPQQQLVTYRIERRLQPTPQPLPTLPPPPPPPPFNDEIRRQLARIIISRQQQSDYVQPTTIRSTRPVTRSKEDEDDEKPVPLDDVDAVKALVKKYRTRPNSI